LGERVGPGIAIAIGALVLTLYVWLRLLGLV
jgi:hypothetical protein